MVSGRGLGHTGGTLDKLDAIPGYRTDLSITEFRAVLAEVGCSIIGQTGEVAPADKRLYALRDVTGTVESIPLITASIMSKKLAEGIDGLVLDVKVGRAAFMKTEADARRLAEAMVEVGESMGKRVVALLTRMEEPLGRMVGNACEVAESIEVLEGGGPADIRELVIALGGAMVELATGASSEAEGAQRIAAALDDGSALARWSRRWWRDHGGDDAARLPQPSGEDAIVATRAGVVQAIDGLEIGPPSRSARRRSDASRSDPVDPAVGIRIDRKVGERVELGAPLATILTGAGGAPTGALMARLGAAFVVGDEPVGQRPIILERVG